MNEKKTGGPAFPIPHQDIDMNGEFVKVGFTGMTLRDYFAGQALVGLMTKHALRFRTDEDAEYCYDIADAMLKERTK